MPAFAEPVYVPVGTSINNTTLRLEKGEELTHEEMDNNFSEAIVTQAVLDESNNGVQGKILTIDDFYFSGNDTSTIVYLGAYEILAEVIDPDGESLTKMIEQKGVVTARYSELGYWFINCIRSEESSSVYMENTSDKDTGTIGLYVKSEVQTLYIRTKIYPMVSGLFNKVIEYDTEEIVSP